MRGCIKPAAEAAYYAVVDVVYNHIPELWGDAVYRRTAIGAVALSAAVSIGYFVHKTGIGSAP